MRVTEVTVKKVEGGGKLLAYVTVVFDDQLAIHDLKVLDGPKGSFIAFPSRKVCDRCPNLNCRAKNHLQAKFCGQCGQKLGLTEERAQTNFTTGLPMLHLDVCHPISRGLREEVLAAVLAKMKVAAV